MDNIYVIDDQNYQDYTTHTVRIAVRGIIFIKDKLAMIKSQEYGDYKFPGGGQELGEDHLDTLIREVKEETGLKVILESVEEFGFIQEKRKSIYDDKELFEAYSYYYFCEEDPKSKTCPSYSDEENELGYQFVLVDINEAYRNNQELIKKIGKRASWIKRETIVLEKLINMRKMHD
jgi:8-oxo-dGTP pyrophosphatase MutT (NUDIX family)